MSDRYSIWQRNAQRSSADRAYGAGAKPKSYWDKKTIARALERDYDHLTAAIADGYPLWFIRDKLLRPWSVEQTGAYGRSTMFMAIDPRAVEAMIDDPYSFDDEYLAAASMRKMEGKLKSRFAREWPRRYALYRRYRDMGIEDDLFLDGSITASELASLCAARCRSASDGGAAGEARPDQPGGASS